MAPAHAPPAHDVDLYTGLYPATVTSLDDEDRQGRIEVELPWLAGGDGRPPRLWATIITPYTDADQGFQMLPEVGSTVVVGFEAGNLRHPYVLGAVWNGQAAPPEPFDHANNLRLIQTRSGSRLEFDDTAGAVAITITTPAGHTITMDDGGLNIKIESSDGQTIELAPAGVTVNANISVKVSAPMVTVDAPVSEFSGIVMCDTLIAKGGGVVSPTYTPGAGNVW